MEVVPHIHTLAQYQAAVVNTTCVTTLGNEIQSLDWS